MQTMFGLMCALVAPPALAGDALAAAVPAAERHARKCQPRSPSRDRTKQGTLLWGSRQRWDDRAPARDTASVLVAAELGALEIEGGRLGTGAVGAVLRGIDSEGRPVEVAICGEEPSADDPGMVWYRIEAWNPVAQDWENPCVATGSVPNPRALAVAGLWDAGGAHHDVKGKVTFACENGVISKCARWGYKPWAVDRQGRSLAGAHQACTRMARADYCGNGKSHTREDRLIEYYDALGLSSRATVASADWDPARASFEAAWDPDGATCLARMRDGSPLAAILQECPERFRKAEVDLGGGDRCTLQRASPGSDAALLRNRVRNP
jgi:hypothetical protein